jgi:O-acetyl-ADP-ribose deacetylase (regulator of RNase III)
MIHFEKTGDIFKSGAQTLIVPVNTVGVMGCGLALAFANRFEGLLEAYKKACFDGTITTKGFFVFDVSEDKKILCFPTKRHWKNPSKIEWIDSGLERLVKDYEKYGIRSVAVPALGCGYGELEWENVRALIHLHLAPLTLKVGVYIPWDKKISS